jgi:alpha-glucan,water dikinase
VNSLAADLQKEVKACLVKSDIIQEGELEGSKWDEAWAALKGVWASKWNDRAYYSCKKANIGQQHVQVFLSVPGLCVVHGAK